MKLNIAVNDVYIDEFLKLDGDIYQINQDGTIFTRISKTGWLGNVFRDAVSIGRKNYRYVNFYTKKLQVHRIIYAKFIGKLDQDLVINHKDGNPSNNSIDNLELVSHGCNLEHRYRVLGYPAIKGYKKISEEIAQQVRFDREKGLKYTELMVKYSLCKSSISYIVNKKTWK